MIKSYKSFIFESVDQKITEEDASELMNLMYNYFYDTFLDSDVIVEYEEIITAPNDVPEYDYDDNARITQMNVSSPKTDYRYEVLCFYNDTAKFKQYPTKVTLKCTRITNMNFVDNNEQESEITDYKKFLADMNEYENVIFEDVIDDGTRLIISNLNSVDDIEVSENGFTEREFSKIIDNLLKHLKTIDVTKKTIVNIAQFLEDNGMPEFLAKLLENEQIYDYYRDIFIRDAQQYFELENYLSDKMKEEFKYLTRGKNVGLWNLKK
jgi:hypothetical protein